MKRLSLISYKSKTREQVYHNSSWLQTDRLPEFAVHWTLESSQDLRGVSSFSSRADGTKKWISVHFMDWSPIWNNSKLNIHTEWGRGGGGGAWRRRTPGAGGPWASRWGATERWEAEGAQCARRPDVSLETPCARSRWTVGLSSGSRGGLGRCRLPRRWSDVETGETQSIGEAGALRD